MPAGSVTVAADGTVTKSGLAEAIYDARVAMLANVSPPGSIPAGPLGVPLKNGLALDATALAGAIYPEIVSQVAASATPPGFMAPYAGSAAPTGWLICNGANVSRTTYAALFAVIGTTYGSGDGSTTFNLPNGRGRALIGEGTGDAPDATAHALGSETGTETHELVEAELPAHSHSLTTGNFLHTHPTAGGTLAPSAGGADWDVAASTASTGGGTAHNNMQPSLTINWIIKT